MGWRFRKSVKILPGVRMNIGSKGITSWSFGGRGVRVNVGKRGTSTTYSLFGTGLSYRSHTPRAQPSQSAVKARVIAQSPSPPPLPGPAPARRSSIGTYAFVGVAALIMYLVLKPDRPVSQDPASPVEASSRVLQTSPPSPASRPTLVAPVSASPSSPVARPPESAPRPTFLRDAVTTTGANVRASASRSGSVVRVLNAGTQVQIVGQEGAWHRVADSSGEIMGWVHGSILR
ncbi:MULTISPECIES: DUF4236 domain-containing protein [Roseomonadaceae]|uniref:DUF4236 domain-containing protein n=1 Tax=Falsiroseomonas oleicola TaxID=2801474 RepID=A0ABS6HCI0_9PROT|nr:DUF4236 domain-containing protein [Roseomonas oleicola]